MCTARTSCYEGDLTEEKMIIQIKSSVQNYNKVFRRRPVVYDRDESTYYRIKEEYPGFDGKVRRMAKCVLTGDMSINARCFNLPRAHPAVSYLLDRYLTTEVPYERDPINWRHQTDYEFLKKYRESKRRELEGQILYEAPKLNVKGEQSATESIYHKYQQLFKKFRFFPDSSVGYTKHTLKYATMRDFELIPLIQYHLKTHAYINYMNTYVLDKPQARNIDDIRNHIWQKQDTMDPYLTSTFIKFILHEKIQYYRRLIIDVKALEIVKVGMLQGTYKDEVVKRRLLDKVAFRPELDIIVRRYSPIEINYDESVDKEVAHKIIPNGSMSNCAHKVIPDGSMSTYAHKVIPEGSMSNTHEVDYKILEGSMSDVHKVIPEGFMSLNPLL